MPAQGMWSCSNSLHLPRFAIKSVCRTKLGQIFFNFTAFQVVNPAQAQTCVGYHQPVCFGLNQMTRWVPANPIQILKDCLMELRKSQDLCKLQLC